jgi:hypothetical protein
VKIPNVSAKRFCDRHTEYHANLEKVVLIMPETLRKNNLNCVKDVTLLHVHLTIIVTVVPDEKNRRHYLRTELRKCGV